MLNCGVLCKLEWVENRARASYFCSKNALSKVMRTIFEVAPAGKCSRRLRVPSPKKSLFSSNCCFPKSCSLTVLHRVWQKQWEERRKWGGDGTKELDERKQGGWKEEGEVKSHRLIINTVSFQGSSGSCSFFPAPGTYTSSQAWRTLQSPPTLAALPLCIPRIYPHCFEYQPPLHFSFNAPSFFYCISQKSHEIYSYSLPL